MKNIIFAVAAMLLLSACTSQVKPPAERPPVLAHFSAENETAAMQVASAFASGFEKSLVSGDFSHFQKVFPKNSKTPMKPEHFGKMRQMMTKLYGTPQELQYVTFLNQGKLRDYLWKITFSSPAKPPQKVPAVREILLCVRVYCEAGSPPAISGFFFQRF